MSNDTPIPPSGKQNAPEIVSAIALSAGLGVATLLPKSLDAIGDPIIRSLIEALVVCIIMFLGVRIKAKGRHG